MRVLAGCVIAVFALSSAALAQTPPPADAPTAPPKDEKPEMICVNQNPAASTRVHSQRVCRTREEWEKRGGVPK